VLLETGDIKPGLYFMTVQMKSKSEGKPAIRHIALSVKADTAHLKTRVSEPWTVWKGSSCGRFTKLNDGTLIFGYHYSTDRGKTWQKIKTGGMGYYLNGIQISADSRKKRFLSGQTVPL
jgi:hypothetical protein